MATSRRTQSSSSKMTTRCRPMLARYSPQSSLLPLAGRGGALHSGIVGPPTGERFRVEAAWRREQEAEPVAADGNAVDVLDLVRRWATAEQHNDAGLLDGVAGRRVRWRGPVGFVLTRDQRLARFRNGLENRRSPWRRTYRRTTTATPRWWWSWPSRPASRGGTTPAGFGSWSSQRA